MSAVLVSGSCQRFLSAVLVSGTCQRSSLGQWSPISTTAMGEGEGQELGGNTLGGLSSLLSSVFWSRGGYLLSLLSPCYPSFFTWVSVPGEFGCSLGVCLVCVCAWRCGHHLRREARAGLLALYTLTLAPGSPCRAACLDAVLFFICSCAHAVFRPLRCSFRPPAGARLAPSFLGQQVCAPTVCRALCSSMPSPGKCSDQTKSTASRQA